MRHHPTAHSNAWHGQHGGHRQALRDLRSVVAAMCATTTTDSHACGPAPSSDRSLAYHDGEDHAVAHQSLDSAPSKYVSPTDSHQQHCWHGQGQGPGLGQGQGRLVPLGLQVILTTSLRSLVGEGEGTVHRCNFTPQPCGGTSVALVYQRHQGSALSTAQCRVGQGRVG